MKVRVEITMTDTKEDAIDEDDFNRIIDLLTTLRRFDSHSNTLIFDVHFTGDFKI